MCVFENRGSVRCCTKNPSHLVILWLFTLFILLMNIVTIGLPFPQSQSLILKNVREDEMCRGTDYCSWMSHERTALDSRQNSGAPSFIIMSFTCVNIKHSLRIQLRRCGWWMWSRPPQPSTTLWKHTSKKHLAFGHHEAPTRRRTSERVGQMRRTHCRSAAKHRECKRISWMLIYVFYSPRIPNQVNNVYIVIVLRTGRDGRLLGHSHG